MDLLEGHACPLATITANRIGRYTIDVRNTLRAHFAEPSPAKPCTSTIAPSANAVTRYAMPATPRYAVRRLNATCTTRNAKIALRVTTSPYVLGSIFRHAS